MDDLDFEPAVPVHLAGIFRPKMKPKSMNIAPITAESEFPNFVTGISIPLSSSVSDGDLSVGSSLRTSETLGSLEPSGKYEHLCSSVPFFHGDRITKPSESAAADTLQPLVNGNDSSQSVFRKSASENADKFSGLECLDDFLTESTNGAAPASRKSPDKVNEKICGASTHCSVESSAFLASDVAETLSDYCATQPPVSCAEAAMPIKHGEIWLETKEFEPLDIVLEAPISTGCHAGKFQPKLRVKKGKDNPNIPHPEVESTTFPQTAHFKTGEMDESSLCYFAREDIHNHISPTFGDCIAPNPTRTPNFQANAERFAEPTQLDESVYGDGAHPEGVCGRGHKCGTGKVSTVSNRLQKPKRSAADEEGKNVRSSRKPRKQLPSQHVVGPGNNTNEDSYNAENCNEHDCSKYMVHTTKQRRRAPRKSKIPVFENEKPGQKRKRTNKGADEPTDEPTKKKFSHSTCINRRRANKSFIEMPEDEIDPQKTPFRDLIRLQVNTKRSEIRNAAKLKTPDSNQRDGVSTSSFSLNYASLMKKSRPVKWSEQDTELFYEGIELFGIDFGTVALLFPGLTPVQIKFKYKKEDRQNPLRIREAKHCQPKDSSKYAQLINKLLKAARHRQESNSDELRDMEDLEEEELSRDNNGEVTKPELNKIEDMETVVAAEVQFKEVAEVHSPMMSNQSEHVDGFGGWSDEF